MHYSYQKLLSANKTHSCPDCLLQDHTMVVKFYSSLICLLFDLGFVWFGNLMQTHIPMHSCHNENCIIFIKSSYLLTRLTLTLTASCKTTQWKERLDSSLVICNCLFKLGSNRCLLTLTPEHFGQTIKFQWERFKIADM